MSSSNDDVANAINVELLPIKLEWYVFSYGHINTPINWKTGCYDCIDGRDLMTQVFHYWANLKDSTILLEQSHITVEEISNIFDTTISKKIPIYDGQQHIIAPIFISKKNEWHMAIVFLLDSSDDSISLYWKLKKLYVDTMNLAISLVKLPFNKDVIKYNRYIMVPQQIWCIGPFKMRVNHILLGIIPHLPSIKIVHRTTTICQKYKA